MLEIVIKIPEEALFAIQDKLYGEALLYTLVKAIEKGTILPRKHGALIDIDELHCVNTVYHPETRRLISTVNKAPILIEASEVGD